MVENAKIQIFKCDILSIFLNNVVKSIVLQFKSRREQKTV